MAVLMSNRLDFVQYIGHYIDCIDRDYFGFCTDVCIHFLRYEAHL